MDLRGNGGKSLARRLATTGRTRTETHTPYYELAERVNLVRHARAMGYENLPCSSASVPNDVECAIEHEFRSRNRAALDTARGDLARLAEDFAAVEDQLPAAGDIEVVPKNSQAGLERDLATDSSISHARRELMARHRDERAFRHHHGLGREARYPKSPLLHLGGVAALVVLEAAINEGFFAAGSAYGLVGGLLTAIGVSLANVASGVLVGYLAFRHLNVNSPTKRVLAVAGIALYVVGAIGFNLTIAHYRDMASASSSSALAVTGALQHPFAVSATSAALLILGLVVSAVSVWHGYTLDDPHPGYGAVARARRKAAEDFSTSEADLRKRGLAHVEAVPARCHDVVSQARDKVKQLRQLTVEARARIERYETERAHNQHWCTVLLRRYRTENESVRTCPAPAYFKVYPELPPELDHTVAERLAVRLDHASERLEALVQAAHAVVSRQPEHMAAARGRLDEFVSECARRADAGRGDGTDHSLPDAPNDPQRSA